MPKRLDSPNQYGGTTDHSDVIDVLRQAADRKEDKECGSWLMLMLAADLLESHDQTGISLDDWPIARRFVERIISMPVIPNGV